MQVKPAESEATGVLKLEGRLTIERTHELKDTLLDALKRKDEVIIDLKDAMEVDVSFLQLLCSAHKSALQMNKNLIIGSERSSALRTVVHQAGYIRTLCCLGDPNQDCLWKGDRKQ